MFTMCEKYLRTRPSPGWHFPDRGFSHHAAVSRTSPPPTVLPLCLYCFTSYFSFSCPSPKCSCPFVILQCLQFPPVPLHPGFVPLASSRTVPVTQPIPCAVACQKFISPRKAGLEEVKTLRLLTTQKLYSDCGLYWHKAGYTAPAQKLTVRRYGIPETCGCYKSHFKIMIFPSYQLPQQTLFTLVPLKSVQTRVAQVTTLL